MAGHVWRGLILAGAFLFGTGAALAQGCGCNPLPSEGVYGTADPFTLTHLDGDKDTCPTQIRVQARRRGAPDVDVILYCQAEKGTWTGVEPAPQFGGAFIYDLRGGPPPLDMASGEYAAQLAASHAMTEAATLEMTLPPMLVGMGKSDLSISLELTGKARAAACICGRVREELDHVLRSKAAYEDPDVLAHARAEGLRGSAPGQNFWMDSNHQLHRLPTGKQGYSFDDLVQSRVETGPGLRVSPDEIVTQGAQNAARYRPGALHPGAYAQTHPVTCKITMIPPKEVAQSCEPAIVLKAVFEHEATHSALCRKLNRPSTFDAPDGRRIDWQTESTATGLYIDGLSAPVSGYYAWAQLPENHAADEAAAYGREASVLENWLAGNCP